MIRIGPRMWQAIEYVSTRPGVTTREVSRVVGPHGSAAYGYRTVMRAVRAGLIDRREHPRRSDWTALYVSDKGQQYLEQ